LPGNPLCGLLESPAFAFELEQMLVVHEAVEQGGDHHDIPKELAQSSRGRLEETMVECFS
jgi:hypothetical protein